jgi:hypothetical protein
MLSIVYFVFRVSFFLSNRATFKFKLRFARAICVFAKVELLRSNHFNQKVYWRHFVARFTGPRRRRPTCTNISRLGAAADQKVNTVQ